MFTYSSTVYTLGVGTGTYAGKFLHRHIHIRRPSCQDVTRQQLVKLNEDFAGWRLACRWLHCNIGAPNSFSFGKPNFISTPPFEGFILERFTP